MIVVYDTEIDNSVIEENLDKICNKIFKLLPMKEEGKDCVKPLETLIIELTGMANLIPNKPKLFSLVCKLQGLKDMDAEIDFMLFRRTIFETCSMTNDIKNSFKKEE